MMSEALQLSNSEFHENQTKYFQELLESQELSDVTLACDDYEIGVHKTVISSSSLFFREVIRKSKHANPYIYLKGISKETLQELLEFIYIGETTINSENVENLVEVGKELQIVGIMEKPSKTKKGKPPRKKNFNVADYVKIEPNKEVKVANIKNLESSEVNQDNDEMEDLMGRMTEKISFNFVDETNSLEKLEQEIEKNMTQKHDGMGFKYYVCNVCQNEKKVKAKMKLHVETHLDGFSHKCTLCPAVKKTRRTIQLHMLQQHSNTVNSLEQ